MFLGPVNIFTIYEPKERRIVSQNVQDKIVNQRCGADDDKYA